MWIDYTYDFYNRVPLMAKPEEPVVPSTTVEKLVTAAEKVQDKFDADPELRDLYPGYSAMLIEIAKKVKNPINENKA